MAPLSNWIKPKNWFTSDEVMKLCTNVNITVKIKITSEWKNLPGKNLLQVFKERPGRFPLTKQERTLIELPYQTQQDTALTLKLKLKIESLFTHAWLQAGQINDRTEGVLKPQGAERLQG